MGPETEDWEFQFFDPGFHTSIPSFIGRFLTNN